MIQEDKLKEAQRLYETANADQRYVLESLFPELKESENEKIRKDLITLLDEIWHLGKNANFDKWDKSDCSNWIAWLEKQVEPEDKGEISDGYHTFNELYYYRMLYNAAFFNSLPKAWVHKSKKHHDGEECFGGGWFIVMANLPTGQISNHYELKDWELFQIPEKEVADEWDRHTPKEAAERLHKYLLRQKEQELLCDKCRKAVENEFTQTNKIELKPTERKEFISIPFGAFDSELIEEMLTIPDGCVATIEGNRIHIKRENKSLTEVVKEENIDNSNKVETKINIGDYVVRRNGKDFHDGRRFAKVIKITKTLDTPMYQIDCDRWLYEDEIRRWTLYDAKDGDILSSSNCKAFIYNGNFDSYNVGAYCGLDVWNNFVIADSKCNWTSNYNIKPATEKECKALFDEMTSLNYVWHPETKKLNRLNKYEQNNN